MRICFGISTNQSLQTPAMGSEHACIGLAKALARRGHKIDVVNLLWDAPKSGYDVYHWVNAHGPKGPYLAFARFAHSQGKLCFSTPIWWPLTKEEISLYESFAGDCSNWLEAKGLYNNSLACAALETDFLLPNSEGEGKVFESFMKNEGMTPTPWSVIYNAVDSHAISQVEPKPWEERPKKIISVGRVEPAKNQHSLAHAFSVLREEDQELQLMLMGEISSMLINNSNLFNLFLQPGINLSGRLPQNMVFSEMGDAKVHVLLGVHETPGLVTLEAAALGCQVVVSTPEFGTIGEYLEGLIEVNPLDAESIEEGIRRALETPPNKEWREQILTKYTYDKIAEEVEEVYTTMLEKQGGN